MLDASYTTPDGEIIQTERLEIEIEVNDRLLVPDGEYEAVLVRQQAESIRMFRGECRLFAHFRIVEPGPYFEKEIFGSWRCKIAVKSGVKRVKAPKNSDLAAMLRRLLGNGTRLSRASLNSIVGTVVRVRTRTVTHDFKHRDLPEAERYSVVDEILALSAGHH